MAVYAGFHIFGTRSADNNSVISKIVMVINGRSVFADVADTPTLRERGLSGTEDLKDNEGMLFVFDEPSRPGFWMKEMNFPLDIIWINADNFVADVSEGLSPSSYPRIFSPKTDIKYALEVQSGFVQRNSIKIGDKVTTR
jgi:uncharacterized membrane protein (UPF0127 family)